MQIAFRFAHAPERIAYPPDAYVTPSRLRRSQMPCDKYSRDGSYILDLPPFPQASLLHNLPASAMRAQTHPPAACASSASLTEHMPRVASPSPASLTRCASHRAITLRLRMRNGGSGRKARAHPLELAPTGCAGNVDSLWPQQPLLPRRGRPYDRPSCASGTRTPEGSRALP